jgi:LuxR family maltose regulon positive regulatory protein
LIASLAQWRPRPETSVTVAVRALKELDELGDHPLPNLLNLTDLRSLETIVTISLGRAHFLAGDMEEARAWLKRGLASEGAAYSIWRISGLGSLGLLEAWCGCTERARTYADEALAVASEVGMLAHPAAADAFLALTLTNLERGEPQHAALSLHEGALRAAANKRAHLSWVAHLELALLQTADGQPESAASSLLTDGSRPGTPPPPIVADRLLALRSQRLRLAGSADRARRTIGDSPVGSSALVFEKVATLLTLGEVGKAEKILEASPDPEPAEPLVDVERQILRAWLSKAQSGHAVAKAHLAEALQVAEPHSLVEVFVRAGPPILSLLAEEWGPDQSFCNRVIERARALSSPHPETALADPLTDRELEILSYLPSRFTNTELADRCYVSLNTMKTHMAHIYRKLDVANRNGAIVRARQLGLL